ncbi:hypothetical protein BDR07DRAFT_1396504 [Suillus spraguei]|nr:hypothetical protein BDR07DRAFT_1443990 [Suillus spraguei]KAG2351544.1 hypothetical protein BDR07DRAFT_1443477 [Suillus spraguei]KAG2351798.1 hypothetical protein BDR07DRAFT_1441588 [Suillus spraguei]KAG2352020.1 hypothetical protein BDR07DRAFT_1440091 [Suillus spraguei]KAG2352056.1 hypothetical protein BDR07DRAFT_1439854 [Suillus spraguei]
MPHFHVPFIGVRSPDYMRIAHRLFHAALPCLSLVLDRPFHIVQAVLVHAANCRSPLSCRKPHTTYMPRLFRSSNHRGLWRSFILPLSIHHPPSFNPPSFNPPMQIAPLMPQTTSGFTTPASPHAQRLHLVSLIPSNLFTI